VWTVSSWKIVPCEPPSRRPLTDLGLEFLVEMQRCSEDRVHTCNDTPLQRSSFALISNNVSRMMSEGVFDCSGDHSVAAHKIQSSQALGSGRLRVSRFQIAYDALQVCIGRSNQS
jgi:hypothetical protein